jgi:large subunit ribosomal protein L24
MATKLHIKKGDTVKVNSGDSKGQQGRVLSVDAIKYRATVEGLNMVSVHTKPSAKTPDGGIIKKEAPIHISNLSLIDGNGKASRIGRKLDKKGKLVRYYKTTAEEVK